MTGKRAYFPLGWNWKLCFYSMSQFGAKVLSPSRTVEALNVSYEKPNYSRAAGHLVGNQFSFSGTPLTD